VYVTRKFITKLLNYYTLESCRMMMKVCHCYRGVFAIDV